MRIAFFVLLSAAAFAPGVLAAETRPPPLTTPRAAYDWTGFYFGGNAGYASGQIGTTDNSITTGGALFGIYPFSYSPPQTFPGADQATGIASGIGGVQAGYNVQLGPYVVGVESAFDWTGLATASSFYGDPVGGPHFDSRSDVDDYATLTGKVGWAHDNLLIYADGGLAVADTTGRLTITPGGPSTGPIAAPFSDTEHRVMAGYTVGAGIALGLSRRFVATLEYQYVDLGTQRYDFEFANSYGSTSTSKAATAFNAVRVGLDYRF